MLHLIWTKDNSTSTSEDGKEIKGVRQRLLECYKNLYFDPVPDPEMDALKQVSRIAKNFVEYVSISYLMGNRLPRPRLTYEATLAELTSLEEMMRIMMEEGQVHQDIIYRLWQIYGRFFLKLSKYSCDMTRTLGSDKNLPKPQRRGTILILGMLALSKKDVLMDKVDVMLQVGLGHRGKVSVDFHDPITILISIIG